MTRRALILAAAGATGWAGWRWWSGRDEARIRRVLDEVADAVAAGASESDLGRLSRVAAIRAHFDPAVQVEAGPPIGRLDGREAVLAAAARAGRTTRAVSVRLLDVQIAVDPDRAGAHVSLTAEIETAAAGGAPPTYDARELDVQLRKAEGAWIVTGARIVPTLRPLG